MLLFGGIVILLTGSNLPAAIGPTTRELLERGALIDDPLAGQERWLLTLRLLIVLLLAGATFGSLRLSVRRADQHFARLALALSLLTFGQSHALLVGPLPADYVSTADAFRLAAYVVLLYGLVARMRSDIAERAVADERLRLSREIHDGLAQQLALLRLRLGFARDSTRSELARAADLATVEELLEGAILEARGAITTLRTGLVGWDEFTQAVQRFVTEFGQNHEVHIYAAFEGSLPYLTSGLQLEILRMLNEACSNAVRHGHATQIEIALVATPDDLTIRVQDNGRGFDLDTALRSGGVGLHSIVERLQNRAGTFRIESMPGQGATLRLWLPTLITDGRRR
jgi:signal transduction histidine kinase